MSLDRELSIAAANAANAAATLVAALIQKDAVTGDAVAAFEDIRTRIFSNTLALAAVETNVVAHPTERRGQEMTSSHPTCAHGPMVRRTGEKNGKKWAGFFCGLERDDPNRCEPRFG